MTASAHPGNLDAFGGHTDHETGAYHYHHGFSAHDHWDMDGDGDVDCPHLFVDMTGSSSGAPSDGVGDVDVSDHPYRNGYNDGYDRGKEFGYYQGHLAGLKEAEKKEDAVREEVQAAMEAETHRRVQAARTSAMVVSVLVSLAFAALGAVLFCRHHAQKLRREHRQELQRLRTEHRRDVNATILRRMSGGDADPVELPEDVTLELKCTPIKGKPSPTHPYGNYTVFISPGGHKYHCRRTCCGATIPAHYFDLPRKLPACMKCRTPMTLEPVPDWYRDLTREPEDVAEDIILADWKVEYRDDALYVTSLDGVTYCYYNASESLYRDFISNPSPERFFRENIKDKLPYVIGDNSGPVVAGDAALEGCKSSCDLA